ncbi:hypothetical protein NUW58_g8169 [Xylaria curta]|uniref:Uncharacterized protein n=1 Tax=Xylaria curta TaxID=42375 RepID=A0ACC1NBW9_9PEZI|nr:hypothetical protein NUW58_g8169 [Xylaria curta]
MHINNVADKANKAEKATGNQLRNISCYLGPAWDSPFAPHHRGRTQIPESISQSCGPSARAGSRGSILTQDSPNSTAVVMSSRGNQRRGPNRNSEISQHGEELAAWKDVKDQLPGLLDMVNQSSANTADMYEQDKLCAEKKKSKTLTQDDLDKLDQLSRQGVRHNESTAQALKEKIEKIKVLRAIVKAQRRSSGSEHLPLWRSAQGPLGFQSGRFSYAFAQS